MSKYDPARSTGVAWAILFAVVLIAVYVLFAKSARSEVAISEMLPITCKPTAEIDALITKRFGERGVAAGITQIGRPLLIYRNKKTGTFSVVIRKDSETTCVVATGVDWTPVAEGKDGVDL